MLTEFNLPKCNVGFSLGMPFYSKHTRRHKSLHMIKMQWINIIQESSAYTNISTCLSRLCSTIKLIFFLVGEIFFSFPQMFHISSFQPVDCRSFQSQKGAFSFTFPSCICLYAHTHVHTNRYTHTPHSGSNASVDVRALPDLSRSHWITRGNIYSIFFNNLYGKRIQKRIDTCLRKLNHFAIYPKPIQHCKSTRLQSKNK